MKRTLLVSLAAILAVGLSGCCGSQGRCLSGWPRGSCADCPENCATCDSGCTSCGEAGCQGYGETVCEGCGGLGCGSCAHPNAGLNGLLSCGGCPVGYREASAPGPATGAITYPYYTNRGARDFLAGNPQSIGP